MMYGSRSSGTRSGGRILGNGDTLTLMSVTLAQVEGSVSQLDHLGNLGPPLWLVGSVPLPGNLGRSGGGSVGPKPGGLGWGVG